MSDNFYFTVEGTTVGKRKYRKIFDNLLDAVQDYIERGYCDFPDGCYPVKGDIYLHIFVTDKIEQLIRLT